ncbi:MAG: hypothetical protein KDH84_21235, partial [Calditrichaeota bacterium]|nr:hypothetical protein [Calditrichota bacterium]
CERHNIRELAKFMQMAQWWMAGDHMLIVIARHPPLSHRSLLNPQNCDSQHSSRSPRQRRIKFGSNGFLV